MNPIVKLAASALPGEKKYILFAGAGVSKDAGTPTSWDLMLKTAGLLYAEEHEDSNGQVDLESWFIQSPYAQMEYAELIESIHPNYPDQQDFLQKHLGNKDIGQAHRGIAQLARKKIIRAVVTTNFDPHIEKAMEEIGLETQVLSNDEDLKSAEPLIQCRRVRIYKPHGDLERGAIRNTPKDLESLSPLMEKELIHVLRDHGVIVLGYAGHDLGIQRVFQGRSSSQYSIFWVNPNSPTGEIENILKEQNYSYILCAGAGQFIEEFLQLQKRIDNLDPGIVPGPTISDIRRAFTTNDAPIGPLYSDYLQSIIERLDKIEPNFSAFEHYDEAIVDQIDKGTSITYDFIEAALVASKFQDASAIEKLYDSFGNFVKLCSLREDFSGIYKKTDFDGYKFIVYEMFVSLVASVIKYDNWDALGQVLSKDFFIDRQRYSNSNYLPFTSIHGYIETLNIQRNKRLNLNRMSVTGDILKERFTNSALSGLLTHREFMEADYFLFLRTACLSTEKELSGAAAYWGPFSCILLQTPPSYIKRAESDAYLRKILPAIGYNPGKFPDFINHFKKSHHKIRLFFQTGHYTDPLRDFDIDKLGTRR